MTVTAKPPIRSGWCHARAEKWSHDRCIKSNCPCECHQEPTMPTPVPDDAYVPLPTGISVVYYRHGEEAYENGWSCLDDAHRFARWLEDTGAAIDVEVIES